MRKKKKDGTKFESTNHPRKQLAFKIQLVASHHILNFEIFNV